MAEDLNAKEKTIAMTGGVLKMVDAQVIRTEDRHGCLNRVIHRRQGGQEFHHLQLHLDLLSPVSPCCLGQSIKKF
jgi:hypothetical protein